MLPSNIDLTENRDFSGFGTSNIFLDTPIEIPMDEYQLMTPEQYDHLIWWEGIFGRKRHYTQKREVFDLNKKCVIIYTHHCMRCGERLKLPWLNSNGICKKCKYIIEIENGKLPWNRKNEIINGIPSNNIPNRNENVMYNLFNRR